MPFTQAEAREREATMLRDTAERARRLAGFVTPGPDREALLDLARGCELRLAELAAEGRLHQAA